MIFLAILFVAGAILLAWSLCVAASWGDEERMP